TPELLRTTTSRLRPKLIWRLARGSAMGGPRKARGLGHAAGVRLGACRLRQGCQTRAVPSVRRGHPVRLQRLAPAGLSGAERCLGALFSRSRDSGTLQVGVCLSVIV